MTARGVEYLQEWIVKTIKVEQPRLALFGMHWVILKELIVIQLLQSGRLEALF